MIFAIGSKMKEFWEPHPALLIGILLVIFLSSVELSPKEGEIRAIFHDRKERIVFYSEKGKHIPTEEEMEILQQSYLISPLTRFFWKEGIREHFNNRFLGEGVGDLISSLLLGTPLPADLKMLFQKTGLLHLVAISGFHFSLLRTFLFALLGLFFQGKTRLTILLLFLGGYALLLGGVPSVLRAFFAALVTMFSLLFHRPVKPLNTFGITLIFTLLFNPALLNHLSFQMSFGITFSILTVYPYLNEKVKMPALEEVKRKNGVIQIYLALRTLFEKSILFLFSVLVMALPLSLYAFHSFPIFSLLINLLFTPLFSLLAGGVVVSTLLPFLDPLINFYGGVLIRWLQVFEEIPLPVIELECPPCLIMLILGLLLGFAIFFERKKEDNLYDFLM